MNNDYLDSEADRKKKIRKKEKKPNPATVFPKSNCPFWQEGVKIEAAH